MPQTGSMARILLCGEIEWAQRECDGLFKGLAELVHMDSPDRREFFSDLKPGGKYDGIVGIYHRGGPTAARIGALDNELISVLPSSVRWLASLGAGYDQIDIDACKRRGIRVSNTPKAGDDATATTALYLIISALRLFSHAERDLRAGKWKSSHNPGAAHDLSGRTLAILGLGGIGLRLAELAHAFPMRILYHSRRKVEHAPAYCEYYPAERLDEMLANADVLSVHVPLNKHTECLVDDTMIRKLRKGAVIVNTARGKVIDEAALIRALEDGHLGAVGLDVFPDEPQVNPRLLDFPNATLLPHVGGATWETLKNMEIRALTNLHDFLTKGQGEDLIPEFKDASPMTGP
ncbi:hypothetical protein OH77DRAFT_1420241 [Trametes cingulata]|nr:hypothetical protein OH77DRAFT_1420241 [Trametes cingulata]